MTLRKHRVVSGMFTLQSGAHGLKYIHMSVGNST